MTGKLITFTVAGAAALSMSVAAQSGATRPGAGSTTTPPQNQTTPPTPSASPSAQVPRPGDNVTFTGCVRQASDQATLFALFAVPPGASSGPAAHPGSTAPSRPAGVPPGSVPPPSTGTSDRSTGADRQAAGASSPGAAADRDRAQSPDARTNQTPAAAAPMAGQWYRLTPASNAQDLKEFVGKTVRVTGVYTPSTRGSTGTENHSMTQFTAGDVSNAPVIAIHSVTPVAMTCTGTTD